MNSLNGKTCRDVENTIIFVKRKGARANKKYKGRRIIPDALTFYENDGSDRRMSLGDNLGVPVTVPRPIVGLVGGFVARLLLMEPRGSFLLKLLGKERKAGEV